MIARNVIRKSKTASNCATPVTILKVRPLSRKSHELLKIVFGSTILKINESVSMLVANVSPLR